MAKLPDSGSGKFGVHIVFKDGDTEDAWRKTEAERDRLHRGMNRAAGVKKVTKISR